MLEKENITRIKEEDKKASRIHTTCLFFLMYRI